LQVTIVRLNSSVVTEISAVAMADSRDRAAEGPPEKT
jgi:hypothetical protein